MPVVLTTILGTLGKVAVSMLMSLLTEKFLKAAVVVALEKVVSRTKDDWDNKLLEDAKKAWNEEK